MTPLVNSSSAAVTHLASNVSLSSLDCFTLRTSVLVLTSYCITSILLIVPVSALVFYLGCQLRRRGAPPGTSHSDAFTFHLLAMETLTVAGCLLFCVGVWTRLPEVTTHAFNLVFSTWCVKIVFHALTCVERYLAVVHPVCYLGLRGRRGVRTRDGSVACVWLLWLLWETFLTTTNAEATVILYYCLTLSLITVVCFCCVSVLWVLRRPGPRAEVGDGERADQRKRRAFYTVGIILGVLCLSLGGFLLADVTEGALNDHDRCAMLFSGFWFSVPSSLVLPALYLHRRGRLPGCSIRV